MTEKEVRDILRGWIQTLIGSTTIHAYQGGRVPALPYAVFNLTQTGAVRELPSNYEFSTEIVDGNEILTQAPLIEKFWRFSINLYGSTEGAGDLRKIKAAMHVPTVLEQVYPLSLFEVSEIRHLPEEIEESQEFLERHQIDIEFHGITRDGFVIDVIEGNPVSINRL